MALPSCAPRERPAATGAKPFDGGTLVRRIESDVHTFNFVLSTTVYEKYAISYLEDDLVEWNQNLELRPGIAKSWTISDDGTTYTFEIDPRARFSDGTPVLASDVVFTLKKIADPATQAVQFAGEFKGLDLDATKAVNDREVKVVFKEPRAGQITAFNIPVLPEHVYGKGDFRKDYNDTVVGTGPYRLVSHEHNKEILLERRDDYWRAKPSIARIRFKVIADDNVAWAAMKRGEIDEVKVKSDWWWNERNTPAVRNTMEIYQFYELAYNFIAWNNRDPILSDKRVRRALSMCLDRASIIENLYRGTARIITGPFTPDMWAYNPEVTPIPYDPEGAKALLESAGWHDSNGDGILDRDHKPLHIEMFVVSGSTISGQIAQILQQAARGIGVDIDVRQLEPATFFQRVSSGDYQSAILGIGIDPDPDVYTQFDSSQFPPNGQNFVYYSNPEADKLIEESRKEFDFAKRKAIFRQLHRVLNDDQPYTWIAQASQKWAVNRRVHNVKVGVGLGFFLWYPDSLEWTIQPNPARASNR